MSAHLLLLATLAWAAPDTGAAYCDGLYPRIEGKIVDDACVTSDDIADACAAVTALSDIAGCPTWATVRQTLDGLSHAYTTWILATCDDGGHAASMSAGEIGYELQFAPDGSFTAYATSCVGACTRYCCSGEAAGTALLGVGRKCVAVDAVRYPGDDTGCPATSAPDPEPAGATAPADKCGCDQGAVGAPWWLLGLVAVRRRR